MDIAVLNGMLNSRLSALEEKKRSLAEASEFKRGALSGNIQKLEDIAARDEKSWAGRLNLSPDEDPIRFAAVNGAANLWAGAVDVERQIASATQGLKSAALSAHIPQEVRDARARQLKGEATPEDVALLSLPEGMTKMPKQMTKWQADTLKDARSNLARIQAWENTQGDIKTIQEAMDADGTVYKGNQAALASQLAADAWEMQDPTSDSYKPGLLGKILPIAKSVATAGYDNPMATAELVVRNAPQLLLSSNVAGSVLTNGAYAMDEFNKGVAAYREANNGAMPSERHMQGMAAAAASLAGAEMLGDKLTLGAGKGLKAAANGVSAAVNSVGRDGLKTALGIGAKAVNNAVGRTALAGIEGATGEYLTEGYQSVVENALQGKTTDFYGEDGFHVAASMGALAGGHTSGGISGVTEATNLAGSAVDKAATKLQEATITKAAVDSAAKTGDVSVFTDPESPVYSPTKALSALFAHNKLDETDDATREANINKGAEILSTMEEDLRTLKAQTPQGKQEIQQDLGKLKAQIAQVDPADTQTLDGLNQSATKLEELLATPVAQGAEAKKLSKQIQSQIKEIEAASSLHEEMTNHAIDKMLEGLDLNEEVAVANAPVDAQDTAAVEKANTAAQKIITLSMVHRDRVTPEQAKQLADNTSNGLNEAARSYFRAFSQARIDENTAKTMDKVSQDVYYGDASKDQMGIPQYRTRLNNALASGSQKMADRTLSLLDKFVSSHTGKEALAQEALAKANETGKMVSVARTNAGTWEILPVAFQTEAARIKNGGFNINPGKGSLNLIGNIQAEAKALTSAQAELQAAYDLKFKPSQATTPAASVASTPNTQPAQPGTTGVGSGASQTPQVAPTQSVGWSRYAKSGQGYEVSSKGDTRFSALNARLSDGRTIEEAYQLDVKGYRDPAIKNQSWKDGKGKPPKIKMTPKQQWEAYKGLWQQWAKENPQLIEELRQKSAGKTLTDMFAGTPVSQARALAEILNETALTTTVSSTATTTKETTNGTETPQAVQAKEEGPQVQPAAGTTATAESQPAANESVKTEEKVEPIDTSEGNVENQGKNEQVSDTVQATQAEYDEAKQVEKTIKNEGDMENVSSRILQILQAESDGSLEIVADSAEDQRLNPESPNYVPPWEELPESASKLDALFDALQGILPNRTFRSLTEDEKAKLDSLLERLRPMLGDVLDAVEHIFIHGGDAKAGTYYGPYKAIGLNESVFTTPAAGLDNTAEERLLRVLTHELSHAKDDLWETIEGQYWSETKPEYQPGGSFYEAAKKQVESNGPAANWFKYIFNPNKPLNARSQTRELFAQYETLWSVNPELFNEAFNTENTQEAETGNRQSASGSTSTGNGETQEASDQGRQAQDEASGEEGDSRQSDEVIEPGKLGVFSTEEPSDKPFKARNLVASDLKQSPGSDQAVTQRPLVVVKDFLSHWSHALVGKFLGTKWSDLTQKQQDLLDLFQKKATAWGPKFQASVGKKADSKSAFRFQDMMQFLLETHEVNGKTVHELAQNITTAMSFATFSYIAEQATKPAFNDDEAINKILGRHKEHPVSDAERDLLRSVGTREDAVINLLGQRIAAALGISAKQNANKDTLSKLHTALGVHAMRVMVDEGILQYTPVSGMALGQAMGQSLDFSYLPEQYQEQISELLRNPNKLADFRQEHLDVSGLSKDTQDKVRSAFRYVKSLSETKHEFLKIKRDSKNKLFGTTLEIYEATVGSQGVLGKLFSVETGLKEPTLKPVPFNQKSTKGTRRWIPKKLADILDKMTHEANFVKSDHWDLWKLLDPETLWAMAGKKDVSEDKTHISERKSREAKNDALRKEIENFDLFVRSVIEPMLQADPSKSISDIDLFFEYDVWKQQRVGLATNLINPQASKVQRFMLARKTWPTKVDPSKVDQLNNFLLRVGEGLGVKTDRQNMERSLAEVKEKLELPLIKAAVHAIIETVIKKQPMTAEYQQAIREGVTGTATEKGGGENFHSMDALIALARQEHAAGQPFTVNMMGEIDGVTNGPMLTHILLGAARTVDGLFARINKGGFFEKTSEKNQFKQYNEYRGQSGQQDLYESLMREIKSRAVQLMAKSPQIGFVWEAVDALTGDLGDEEGRSTKDGRNFVKTPLTALIFGSSPFNSKLRTAEKFVTGIYRKIAELDDSKHDERRELIQNINVLLNQSPKWSLNMTAKEMRETVFTPAQVEAIMDSFNRTLGRAVQDVMKDSFRDLIERRDSINKTAELAYTLYSSLYQAMRKEYLTKLMTETGDTTNPKDPTKKEALHDLTEEQEAALQRSLVNMLPTLQTFMSLDSGDDRAGLSMVKSRRKISRQKAYQSEVVFGTPFTPSGRTASQGTKTAYGYEEDFEAPGKAMLPFAVHSLDSGISHYAALLSEVLNIHDAHGTGLGNFFNAARNLNHSTWNALLAYSPAEQMYLGLERTVTGFAEVLGREDTSPEVVAAVKSALQAMMDAQEYEGSIETFLSESLMEAKQVAFDADKIRLEALSKLAYVDQYALEGGNYEVTDKDRAEAQKKLNELLEKGSDMSEKTWESLDKVSMALTGKPAFRPTQQTSAWGEVGNPSITSASNLVAYITSNGNKITAKEAVNHLNRVLKDELDANGFSGFKRKLLGRILRSIDPNTVIKYVTPETPDSEVLGKPDNPKSRAWIAFNPATGKAEIYVLSKEHKYSGLTDQTLLHELLHAATFMGIRAGENKANASAAELVADLNQLLKAATAKIKSSPELQAKYEHMVQDLDELVAWGMSDEGFQNDVLKQIQLDARPRGSAVRQFINGMRAFIKSLSKYVFGEDAADKRNGLQALIEDTTALMKVDGGTAEGEVETRSQAHNDPVGKIDAYTTEDIYNALDDGSVSTAFSEQLKGLLDGIVRKLHGPFGSLKADLMKSRALSPMDVWLKTLDTGKAPFASVALNAGFNISEQEAFVLEQVEVTVEAALKDNEGQTTAVYSELRKLYEEATRKLKPSDFSDPALYDFLFKVEAGSSKKSDYLSRFAALGLAHEEVSKLLQFYTDRDTRTLADAKTMLDKLKYLFNKALTLLNGKLTHTREGMMADDKLKTLVEQLVAIEDKKRRRLIPQDKNFLTTAEDLANDLTDGVREKVTDLLKSDFVKNNKNGFIKLGATLATVSTQGQMGQVLAGIQKIKDQHLQQKNGLIMGLVNDVRGPKAWMEKLLRMRKKQEQDRKFIITETGKSVLAGFSKKLSTEQSAAVTSVFMRTDLKSFLGHYDTSEIQELLEDPAALQNAIIEHEADLREFKDWQHYYVIQSKLLAYEMVHGQAKGVMVMQNAGNIAKLLGTQHVGKISDAKASQAEAVIDRLTTLYALQETDAKELHEAKQVLRDEMNRGDGGNGVELVMKLHKALEDESRATLFRGNEVLMMKGYTPEIYNPHTDVKVATTPEELKELKRQGYTNEGELKQDTADGVLPGGWVMVLRDGGLQSWQTAAMSFTGRQAKGSKMQSNYTNPFDEQGLQNANNLQDVLQAKQAEIDRMFQPNPSFNPANEKRNFMVPVMNGAGTISNWRYLMNNSLKDKALDRDSRVDQVLGMLAGSVFDKQTAGEVNRQVVQALKDHADKEFVYHPKSFVKVSHDSSDPEMRELYAMLPKETREDIRRIWGKDGMRVPYEMLDVVFGYRKATMASIWEKEKEQRNMAENALVWAVETMLYQYGRHVKGMTGDEADEYSKRGAVTMRRAENIWQEIVRETKDTIVVKTGTVLVDNILSNMSLLSIHGVSPLEMIRHHRVAFKAARAYQADKSKLFQLRQKIDLGLLSPEQERKALAEITKLEDAIARNPVMPLIDAGLMPTIVEDVGADDDIYSYKSQLARKLSKYEDKVHPMVSHAARGVYMAHDTTAYKFLSEVTQLSDFVARYTLYQHLTTKKNNPLSHEAAVREASESFINYDVPMHKSMQYFDDMGIIPFMKYTLRIQRVLVRLTREHPARVLSAILLNNMFDALPLVTDSGMLGRIGNNPLQWGAFKYPTVLDDLATVNSALTLMK